jgi:arginyl-tRNA synthetase
MKTLKHLLEQVFLNSFQAAFPDINITTVDVVQTASEKFGHYQCNSPLSFAKEIKNPPRAVAEAVVREVEKRSEGLIEKLEIAGPGFINITISKQALNRDLMEIIKDPYLGMMHPSKKKRIIVEFSSPNIAKDLHVGHLRSTIIGECLARIFEFFGHDVIRLNHVGDWGTQFGMLICYLREFQPQVIEKTDLANLDDLVGWYKKSKEEFDRNPDFKKRSQEEVVKLQSEHPDSINVWRQICEISRSRFNEIYRLLNVINEERGESFYNPYLRGVVKDFEDKGLVTISDGAKCVFMDGFFGIEGEKLPLIIQKTDGGYNYATTDLAAFKYRTTIDRAERILIVTDAGQKLHFSMVSQAAELVGYLHPNICQFDHVTFGVVLGEDGKKFKTRSGETVRLIDLLLEAVGKAKELLKERFQDARENELEESAKILGINAVKYADLASSRIKDYTFSFDRMLKFQGNTAVFLLYSYVRIRSIQRKVGRAITEIKEEIDVQHPSEIALGLHLRRFGEVLALIDRDLMPHQLAEYLYALAEKFNAFFRDCRVEGDPKEGPRLLLSELTARILEKGLNLLGLSTLEKM